MSNNLPTQDLQVIAGLGNPGIEYCNTWHNLGFLFIDYLLAEFPHSKTSFNKANIELYELENGLKLIKPLSYMNNSGVELAKYLSFYKIEPKSLLVAFDDLDLEFPNYKLQFATNPKSHNGVNSVIENIGTEGFWSLRLGANTPKKQVFNTSKDYVLSTIDPESLTKLTTIFSEITRYINKTV
jgi:PTH1 family peptidyl-tRNA hydrolase